MLLFALAGCASSEAPRLNNAASGSAVLTNEETEGEGICNADRAGPVVGQTVNASTLQQASELSGAKTVRALRPDQVVTLEYNSQRLNLRIDAQNKVTSVDCG